MVVDSESSDRGRFRNVLMVVVGLIFFPLLPIGVAFNIGGIADNLSGLPGIKNGGGLISGFSALMIIVVAGLTITVAAVSLGADISIFNSGDVPSPTPTETPVSTPTPTPTTASTTPSKPTPTVTVTPELLPSDLERFKVDYQKRLNRTMENDTLTEVPILGMGYHEMNDGKNELWAVYRECDSLEYVRNQRYTVAADFANAVGNTSGSHPDRLRAYGVVSLESYNDSITYIPTSSAEAVSNGTTAPSTYAKNWDDRIRTPTRSESEIAFQIVVNQSGQSIAEEAFHEHYPANESDWECSNSTTGK